jgi:hypothetical protein
MLLRRSGEQEDREYNLSAIISDEADESPLEDTGVAEEKFLFELAEAVFSGESIQLVQVREKGKKLLGDRALVDAIGVAAGFNGITKIANATGLPLDKDTETSTVDMRQQTRIDEFGDAHKSHLYR